MSDDRIGAWPGARSQPCGRGPRRHAAWGSAFNRLPRALQSLFFRRRCESGLTGSRRRRHCRLTRSPGTCRIGLYPPGGYTVRVFFLRRRELGLTSPKSVGTAGILGPRDLPVRLRSNRSPRGYACFGEGVVADEPAVKRAVAFFDGQNLYRHAKDAFGHSHPNYHPVRLFDAVCADKGWENRGVRFYTGTPAARHSPMWHGYWANRLLAMRHEGIFVESRPIRYWRVKNEDGSFGSGYVPQEKRHRPPTGA